MAKPNDRCFCYFTAAMFVSLREAQSWRLHTKLYKFVWNTSPNNGRMKNYTDLNLGNVVYISIIFHIPASWLNLLNGYDFYFWWSDTANQPYTVLVYNIHNVKVLLHKAIFLLQVICLTILLRHCTRKYLV